MKGRFFLCGLLFVLFLASCSNSPDDAALSATVQAAVDQAISAYEAKNDQSYVSKQEFEDALARQSQDLQDYVTGQVGMVVDMILEMEEPSKEPSYIENGDVYATETVLEKSVTPAAEIANGSCDDQYEYVMDITVPDGSDVPVNTIFPKTWYIKNTGSCTWNSNYKLVYFGGEEVGTAKSFSILKSGNVLKPGESIAVSAELSAPSIAGQEFVTTWAIQSDKKEIFGSGKFKDIYLRSDFVTSREFNFVKNFSSATCSDDNGYFTCGISDTSSGRGVAYYDPSPTLESRITGQPSIVVAPPSGIGGTTRLVFGPIRMPNRSWFYTNFCCRPETPGCDVNVRLYVREPGYDEVLLEEIREWNDGFIGEWKFSMDTREQFDQDLYYIIEVEAIGEADKQDLIVFQNMRIY